MSIDWNQVRDEVTGYAADLIRMNTVNPPGNEAEAVAYLQEILHREAIETTVYASASKRGNLVAVIQGTGEARPLILLSHLDVAAVNLNQWKHHPFSGEINDGYLWGRGALTVKSMLAMELMAFLLYKRSGERSTRDIIMVATANAEAGSEFGMEWLIDQNVAGLKTAEFVINEGGEGTLHNGLPVYACQNGEKGGVWVRLTVQGMPGSAAIPRLDNPILKLAGVLHQFTRMKRTLTLCETTRAYLTALARQKGLRLSSDSTALDLSLKLFAGKYFKHQSSARAMFYNTITPTVIKAGEKVDILPEYCELMLDCRLLPGETTEEFLAGIKNIIHDPEIQFEVIRTVEPTESPVDTSLFRIMEKAVRSTKPNAFLVPYLSSEGTDSRIFRRHGITAYGFVPIILPETELQRRHGIDERISLDNLEEGTRILYEVVREMAAIV